MPQREGVGLGKKKLKIEGRLILFFVRALSRSRANTAATHRKRKNKLNKNKPHLYKYYFVLLSLFCCLWETWAWKC